ncbi:TPA: hypothetical protein DCG82_01775 [candidate division WOR-3]|uniref:Uncharacterized protein n=1 Tax=candidate division WOR-3 bacterium TaxID=2052148 RepID=A0A348MJ92_UNCW3|nr:hypothetical protein [candidate division WOR-3 bacterium]HCP16073.1 hypothetical protein [candidate division WOR-3 bacterium]
MLFLKFFTNKWILEKFWECFLLFLNSKLKINKNFFENWFEIFLTFFDFWLRKNNSMRNFGYRFDIRTFQAERGKYRIEIINC